MEQTINKTTQVNDTITEEELGQNILNTLTELCSTIELENECINKSKPKELEQLVPRKNSLSEELINFENYLKNRGEKLTCSPELKDKIKNAQERLNEALEDNHHLLQEAIDVNDFVLSNIKEFLAKLKSSGNTYNASGNKNYDSKTLINYSIDGKY